MNVSDLKKLLLVGTAVVAVGATGINDAHAADVTVTGPGIWSSAGTNADNGTLEEAEAGANMDLGNFTVTFTDDNTANDSGGVGVFTVGAITDSGTGSLAYNSNAADVDGTFSVGITSISIAGGVSMANTGAHDNDISSTVSGTTLIGSNLVIANAETDSAEVLSLTLTGDATITGVTSLTSGSFAGANSVLTLGGGATFTGGVTLNDGTGDASLVFNGGGAQAVNGNIQGGGAGQGSITISNTSGGVTFNGEVGGTTTVDTITVNNDGNNVAATFMDDVGTANGISIGDNSGADTNTVTFDSTNGTFAVAGAINGGGAADTVELKITGTNTVTFNGAIGSDVDDIDIDSTGTADFNAAVSSDIDFDAAGFATFANGVDLTGSIASTGGTNGTVNFSDTGGGSDVSGAITGVSAVNITGASGDVEVEGNLTATTVTISGSGALLDFDGTTLTGAVNISNDGTLNLAAGSDVTGTVDNTGTDGTGSLVLDSTGGTTISGAVGGTNSLDDVTLNGTGTATFSSTIDADDIDFGAAGTLDADGDITTANGLDFNSLAGTIDFADNSDVTGNVFSTGGANGTVNFAGTSTITGNLGSSAGTGIALINVDGASETVTVTGQVFGTAAVVDANATLDLDQDATFTGALTNNGTIAVDVGEIVTANGGFLGTGTYTLDMVDDGDQTADAGDFGSLAISGVAADLSAETLSINMTGRVVNGDYTIVNGDTGTAVDFATSSIAGTNLVTSATTAVSGSDIVLTVASNIEGAATTLNNKNVGAVLDTLTATTDTQIDAILDALQAATTTAAVDNILEASGPTVDGGAVQAGLNFSSTGLNMTADRLAYLRDNGESGMAAGNMAQGVSVWAQAFGTTGQQDSRDLIDGYDFDTVGIAAGADTQSLYDGLTVGLGVAYATTDVDSENANRTETEVDSYQISLYSEYDVDDRTYVNGQIGYVFGNNDTTRYNVGGISGLTAKGDYDSNQIIARVEAGRTYPMDYGMRVTPKALVNYVHYDADKYTETGAGGANLTIDNEALNVLEFGLGADAKWTVENSDGSVLEPVIHAGVRHDVIGDRIETSSTFAGGGVAFKSQGFDPGETTFDIGAGVTFKATNNWELTADYDFEVKQDFDAHSGLVKASYKF